MSNELPERWTRRMVQQGYVRDRGEGANLSALAQAIGVHTSTVSNALRGGRHSAKPETIAKIVAALGEDTAAWFDLEVVKPWDPPASSALLTDRQRRAVEELIAAMTEGRDGHERQSAPIDEAQSEKAGTITQLREAAKRGKSRGRAMRDETDALGEEPQDE